MICIVKRGVRSKLWWGIYCHAYLLQSRKLKTVLLNETTRFPFLGSIHLRRFNLLRQKNEKRNHMK